MWKYCWNLLLMTLWGVRIEAFYHLNSMIQIPKPVNVTNDSLFGYGIAYQPTSKRLIISAPNDEIGKIYECDIKNRGCLEIKNNIPPDYLSTYPKMWLGASIATGKNFTVACAPRFMEQRNKTGTFGRCFVSSPSTSSVMTGMEQISDKDKTRIQIFEKKPRYELYMDSLGWSIDSSETGSIVVGGPGMFKGRAIEYSNVDAHPKLFYTGEKISFNYGYSITHGNFRSENTKETEYAISSPYGKKGEGLVLIQKGNVAASVLLPPSEAPEVGIMFGASLAAGSLFPSGPQALLVGAPAYVRPKTDQIDLGAVFIYRWSYNSVYKKFITLKTIVGKVNRGRFGSAIVNLGDLDGDNIHDMAIAAPYEDSGAVYIYSGAKLVSSSDGQLTHMQKISPAGFNAFGLTLAVLQDYDDNGCNELAISAPENNTVVVLSCLAKISVNVHELKEKSSGRKNETYYGFESCVSVKYPKKPTSLSADIQVKITITHFSAKLVSSRDGETIVYDVAIRDKKKAVFCQDVGITIPDDTSDRMVQYEIKVVQLNSPRDAKTFDSSRVLISELDQLVTPGAVWLTDCAEGSECRPQFENITILTFANNYMIGSTSSERVSVSAINVGEPAYTPCLRLRIAGAPVLRYPASCRRQPLLDALECQPKAPVKKNSTWITDEIELDMSSVKSDVREILFQVHLYPECSKEGHSRNELAIKLRPDPTELLVRGITNIGNTLELTSIDLEETGKHISHDYSIYNFGVTDWVDIKCEITLQKQNYFDHFPVNMESAQYVCTFPEMIGADTYKTVCSVYELKKNQKFIIKLPIRILPGKISENQVKKSNFTISSQIKVTYGKYQLQRSVTSVLKLKASLVPIWVIVVAVLVGIVIIGLIIFALYECGYFRRKNKDKLQKLEHNYRQSLRRSQMQARESMRKSLAQSSEREKLVDDADEAGNTSDVVITDTTDEEKVPQTEHSVEKATVPVNRNSGVQITDGNSRASIDESKTKNRDQIIKGLQKNLNLHRSNQFLAMPPNTSKDKDQ